MEKCIGCELCAGVCPARCIYVRGADNPIDDPVSPGERYGFVYEINYLRCIHCDLCVEACPTEAITETKLFEFSFTNRADAIYTKDELLVGDDGRAKRLPWELWLGGEDDDTSAWMRATSPSGIAGVRGPRQLVGRARLRRPAAGAGSGRRSAADGAVRLMEAVIFFVCAAAVLDRRARCRARAQPGALGAVPAADAGQRSPCCSCSRTPTSSRSSRSSCTRARSSCCSCS